MKYLITVVITVVVMIGIAIGVGKLMNRNKVAEATKVTAEHPHRGDLVELVSAPGEIQPKTKVALSAKVTARVDELPFEEGERVTAGNPNADPPVPASLLVKLDSKDLESQLRSAQAGYSAQAAQTEVEKARIASQKAAIEGIRASLEQARRDMERQQTLLKSRDISQATFDQTRLRVDEFESQLKGAEHTLNAAELNLVVLEYNLEAAQARIEQAQEALEYTTIRSPIDGVITRINAEVGEVVITGTMNNPGTVIMEVADLSRMILEAQIDEADIAKIQEGQKAHIRVQAYPDRVFDGTVDTIALRYDSSMNRSKYFKTEITVETAGEQFYSGLTADVDIEAQVHTDVMLVPSHAVLGRTVDSLPDDIRKSPEVDRDKTFATVVYRFIDGKAVVTPVRIGTSNLSDTIILSGLSENDLVIVGPYKVLDALNHDQAVELLKKSEEKKDDTENTDSSDDPDVESQNDTSSAEEKD